MCVSWAEAQRNAGQVWSCALDTQEREHLACLDQRLLVKQESIKNWEVGCIDSRVFKAKMVSTWQPLVQQLSAGQCYLC